MASTKDEITAIAIEHGYTGKKPDSIAKAIDALADTLAGEDVTGSRSISGAVKALAPYIGSGGGSERVELFSETVTTREEDGFNSATLAFEGAITDDPLHVTFDGVEYDLPRAGTGYGVDGETSHDFSIYPLYLYDDDGDSWILDTETAGTHTIVAYTEAQSGLGTGYSLRTDVAATVYASDQPLDSGLDAFGAKLALSIVSGMVADTGQLMPAGLYVAVVIENPSVEPTASGVDATIETLGGNTYAVNFRMPSNAVSITAIN